MQVITDKHVEQYCYLGLGEFMTCVTYNLILVLSCAAHAFLTRKLPENFNESWYLFVAVSTTTFLWIVFIPMYFSAFHALHQAALLAFCLLANALCVLLCLFLPKIYAVRFLDETVLQIGPLQSSVDQSTVKSRVHPSESKIKKSNR